MGGVKGGSSPTDVIKLKLIVSGRARIIYSIYLIRVVKSESAWTFAACVFSIFTPDSLC